MNDQEFNFLQISNAASAIVDVLKLPEVADTLVIYRVKDQDKYRYWNYKEGWHEILTDASEVSGPSLPSTIDVTLVSPQMQTVAKNAETQIIYKVISKGATTGIAEYKFNGVSRYSEAITVGTDIPFIVTPYLRTGSNLIEVIVTDNLGRTGKNVFEVKVIELTLQSNFNDEIIYTGTVPIYFKALGDIVKTTYIMIDGVRYSEYDQTSQDESRLITLRDLTHKTHRVEIYATTIIDTHTIISEPLVFNVIYASQDSILISSKFPKESTKEEGTLISIDYIIHNPTSSYTDVQFLINDEIVSEASVDSSKHYWNITEYPIGDVTFTIKTISSSLTFNVTITPFNGNVSAETTGLELELLPTNNSNNNISTRDTWVSSKGDVIGTLSNFNYKTNGWISEPGKRPYLRVNGDATVTIPFKIFNSDILVNGKTIEFEFATKNISDLTKEIVTCYMNNKGLRIFPTSIELKTQNSLLEINFKDNEILKVSIVIEPEGADKLIRIYVNGILSKLYEYTSDVFTHEDEITIVGDIDLYSIRTYGTSLTSKQVLNNYIADLDITDKKVKIINNNIYDNNSVSYNEVYDKIPTLLIVGELPLTKGDPRTVSASYHNPRNATYDFYYPATIIDVQGTSSVMYPRKNWKCEFPETFVFTEGAIAESVYTFKADYMESSHSHNTGNAKLINKFAPKFPTQQQGNGVRNTINGFPILLFHAKDAESEVIYQGVYNFNNDKSNAATLGLTTDKSESWEFKNNTSDLCLFKTKIPLEDNLDLSSDLEARYPKKYKNYDAIRRLWNWVVDTSEDNERFKTEFENYFNLDACLFYYVMMDVMLATDSRAKNMFLDTVDGEIWYPRWYDIDTTYGLDNEGHYKFDPVYEQTDEYGSGHVYNGYNSVLWNNFGIVFKEEIKNYYLYLRAIGLDYTSILEILYKEQIDVISEAMYNEDAEFKYVYPITRPEEFVLKDLEGNILPNDTYAYVAQGSRLNQLQWWVSHRLYYLDSKYEHPTYLSDYITLRAYSQSGEALLPNIEITQYIAGYCKIKYGSHDTSHRLLANTPTIIEAPTKFDPNDTETFIYGASRILDLGDLTPLYPGTVDVSRATKLTDLRIGTGGDYVNTNLTSLTVGNSPILETIDVRGCTALTGLLNLSGCPNIRSVRASRTSLSQILLTEGGNIQTLNLPAVSTLKIKNQTSLSEFTIDSYDNLQILHIENCPIINTKSIVNSAYDTLESAYIDNINWELLESEITLLDRICEIKDYTLKGNITIKYAIGESHLNRLKTLYPDIVFNTPEGTLPDYTVIFHDASGNPIYYASVIEGKDATYGGSHIPSKPDSDGYNYTFYKWDKPLTNITSNLEVHPIYLYNKPTSFEVEINNSNTEINFTIQDFNTCRFEVNWGDNTSNIITSNTFTHTYQTPGVYTISILCIYTSVESPVIDLSQCGYYVIGDIYFQDIYTHFNISNTRVQSCVFPRRALTSKIVNCVELTSITINKEFQNSYQNDFSKSLLLKTIKYNGNVDDWCNINFVSLDSTPTQHGAIVLFKTDIGYEAVHTLDIRSDITELNPYTFYGFDTLETLYIRNPNLNIDNTVFAKCTNIQNLYISNTTPIMEPNSGKIYSCIYNILGVPYIDTLKEIHILPSTNEIPGYAFYNMKSNASLYIPSTVTEIAETAFSGSVFANIFLESEEHYIVDNGVLYNKEKTTIFKITSSISNCVLPNTLSKITSETFKGSNLVSLDMSMCTNIDTIPSNCFQGLKDLAICTLPNTVHTIGNSAFKECGKLVNITLPESLVSIGSYAFYSCRLLETIDIPDSVTEIGAYAFSDCDTLNQIIVPNNVHTIGIGTFKGCDHLVSVQINADITTISDYMFQNCFALININIPNTVIEIGTYAFDYCKELTTIKLPSSIATIGNSAFSYMHKLSSITIPKSVTYIPNNAFKECGKLVNITLPESLVSIGSYAFYSCRLLETIDIPDSVTEIGTHAFEYCASLTSITVPQNVTIINEYTFAHCATLLEVSLPETVTTFKSRSFAGVKLNELHIPNGLTFIDKDFAVDTRINTITIQNDHPYYTIKDNVLYTKDMSTIVKAQYNIDTIEYTTPNTVTTVFGGAFAYTQYEKIILNNNVTELGIGSFASCTALYILQLPETITIIPSSLCDYCLSLNEIVIPDSVTLIDDYAFNCNNLKSVVLPENIKEISANSFSKYADIYTVYNESLLYLGDLDNPHKVCVVIAQGHTISTCKLHENTEIIASGALTNSNIKHVYTNSAIPCALNSYAINSSATIHVPKGSLNTYKTTIGWAKFTIVED